MKITIDFEDGETAEAYHSNMYMRPWMLWIQIILASHALRKSETFADAARMVGMKRTTLFAMVKRLGLTNGLKK